MQTKKKQLIRQQQVLKALGYYSGLTDGIWGPASIKAKRDFEADPGFAPALQNNGLPFDIQRSLPKGVSRDPNAVDLLWHPKIEELLKNEAELVAAAPKAATPVEPKADVSAELKPSDNNAATVNNAPQPPVEDKSKHVHSNKRHKR